MSFLFAGISDYHKSLCEGKTTVSKTVEYYLEKIEANLHLNAMVEVFGQEAKESAAALDQDWKATGILQPLHGVIITIKDVICYAGHRVSAGSKMLENFVSLYSATVVERLISQGAIIIGTTNCDEFAMGSTNENSYYGPVKNAADHERVPGGSSGGAAVSVQAGLCMIALGSDTGGSVRQPADYCGVIGFKPSYGRISRYGLLAYASSFDCIGILGMQLDDVWKIYEIIAGYDTADSTAMQSNPEKVHGKIETPASLIKFAILENTLDSNAIDPEISKKLVEQTNHLKTLGHTIQTVQFDLLEYLIPAYYVLTTAEASSNLGRYDGIRYGYRTEEVPKDLDAFYANNRSGGFGKEVKRRIMLGNFVLSTGYFDAYYLKAQRVREAIAEEISKIFVDFDAILMPVSPTIAPLLHQMEGDPVKMYMSDIFTVLANLAKVPAIALPLFTHSSGLPFGLQVMCKYASEAKMFQIAKLLLQENYDKKEKNI